jgi:hypothetical protein
MSLVLLYALAEHEDVVQVYVDEYSNVMLEKHIHQPLKG